MTTATMKTRLLRVVVYLLYIQCCLSQPLDSPPCSSGLENVAVLEGAEASFRRVIASRPVQWRVCPTSVGGCSDDVPYITNYDDNVTAVFANTYAVNETGLLILASTLTPQGNSPYSTAGLYISNYQNPDCMTSAGLTVVKGSGPVCTRDASDPNDVKLSCSVEYANVFNQEIYPIITWKTGNEVLSSETLQPPDAQPRQAVSTYHVASDDPKTYECHLNFSAPMAPQLPSTVATNAPNFTKSCFIPATVRTETENPSTYTTSTSTLTTNSPNTASPAPYSTLTTSLNYTIISSILLSTLVASKSETSNTMLLSEISNPSSSKISETSTPSIPSLSNRPINGISTLFNPSLSSNINGISTPSTAPSSNQANNYSSYPLSATHPSTQSVQSSPTSTQSQPGTKSVTTGEISNGGGGGNEDQAQSQAQAQAIVLGIVFAALLNTAVVLACWWIRCFPPSGQNWIAKTAKV